MEAEVRPLGLPAGVDSPTEALMIREDVVREMLARLARGEGVKRIARELGVDRKTVKAWRRRGGWRPRPIGGRRRALEAFVPFIEARAPEVGWNSVVLHRELQGAGVHRRLSAGAAVSAAAPRGAAVGGPGHGAVRAGPASRLRSTSGSSGSGSATSRRRSTSSSSPSAAATLAQLWTPGAAATPPHGGRPAAGTKGQPMKQRKARKGTPSRICSQCKADDAKPIVYGYPGSEAGEAADQGKLILGGCLTSDDDAHWQCSACGHRW